MLMVSMMQVIAVNRLFLLRGGGYILYGMMMFALAQC